MDPQGEGFRQQAPELLSDTVMKKVERIGEVSQPEPSGPVREYGRDKRDRGNDAIKRNCDAGHDQIGRPIDVFNKLGLLPDRAKDRQKTGNQEAADSESGHSPAADEIKKTTADKIRAQRID